MRLLQLIRIAVLCAATLTTTAVLAGKPSFEAEIYGDGVAWGHEGNNRAARTERAQPAIIRYFVRSDKYQ